MLKLKMLFLVFIMISAFSHGQDIRILSSGKHVSLRGLSAVNNHIIWVSGTSGTVGLSVDGGKTGNGCVYPGTKNLISET